MIITPIKPDQHRRPTIDTRRFRLRKTAAKTTAKQRHGITDRNRLRQRQMHQAVKSETHGENTDEAAREMTENVLGVEGGAQMPFESEIAEDRHHGEAER